RAPARQAGGRWFEPNTAHQILKIGDIPYLFCRSEWLETAAYLCHDKKKRRRIFLKTTENVIACHVSAF
ncbi:MAG TPA: hypothetical protein VN381_05995, partial [Anaerovoracaceae bacterium]|nr:hypothetical protein [Anaerovoracaceae bacterium]